MARMRQNLEDALAESQERLRQLSEAMFEAVAIHDRGTIVEVNETCSQLFGYSRDEAVGRNARDLATPEWRELVAEHIETGTQEPYEARGLRKDGSTFWGEVRARPVPYGGRRLGMLVIRDIDERYEAGLEQRRRLAQERVHRAVLEMESVEDFGHVVEIIAAVLDEMDVEYEAVGLNTIDEAAGTLTGHAIVSGRLIAQSVNELSHPANQDLLGYWRRGEVMERAPDADLRELTRRYSDDTGRRYDPSVIIDVPFAEGTLVVGLHTPPGDNDQLIALLQRFCPLVSLGFARTRDMAERQRAEDALRQAHDELEQRIRDRTGDLSAAVQALQREIAVRQSAEVQLTESLREKELLLKEIHHRVKNNLQIISSLLSLQGGYVADEQVSSHLENTRNRVMSMALIHESLYQSADLHRIDVGEYVTTLCERLFESYGVDQKRIGLRLETEAIPLSIETAIPCGLILNELISNALQHAFPDGRAGSVDIALQGDDAGGALLSVSDDGVGMAAEIDVEGRESLGLVLVQTLARQLGARCQVERQAGTRFTFRLPPTPPR